MKAKILRNKENTMNLADIDYLSGIDFLESMNNALTMIHKKAQESNAATILDIFPYISLKQIYALKQDKSFGTDSYIYRNDVDKMFNDDMLKMIDFIGQFRDIDNKMMEIDEKGFNRQIFSKVADSMYECSKIWLLRQLCALKSISLWEDYKRVYSIDGDWYNDFINTEDMPIDFSLLNKLPYDSFYIDLSKVEFQRTDHYTNITGLFINIVDNDNIHITIVDNVIDVTFNPLVNFSGDLIIAGVPTLKGSACFNILRDCFLDDTVKYAFPILDNPDAQVLTLREYAAKYNGVIASVPKDKQFPKNWFKYDFGGIRFVDFMINKSSNGNTLSKDASECFGWKAVNDIDETDMQSPVLNQLMRFTIQFLYFLHSKTEDIIPHIEEEIGAEPLETGLQTEKIKTYKPIRKWDVGFHYGEKIRSVKRKCRLYGNNIINNYTGGDRNRPRAYVRKAHWHNYWCGSNETRHLEPRWLEPIYCNGSVSDIIMTINEVTDKTDPSKGKYIIGRYLDKMNVSYEKDYHMNIKGQDKCFDYRVFHNQKEIFIEYDNIGFKADWNKSKYLKQAKIPVLHIRYDQVDIIPDLIDEFLEHPSIHRINPRIDNAKYYR